MTPSATQTSLAEEIEKIIGFVQTAQQLIHQDTFVDIALLRDQTHAVCSAVQKAPILEAKALLPQLEKLLKSIERLEMDLNMQHDAVCEHLKTSSENTNPLFAQEVNDDKDDQD